jgi:alkane 1-monooxygenase
MVPLCTWYLFSALDFILGLDLTNRDPETPHAQVFWHRLITLVWAPVQFAMLYGMIFYVVRADHLNGIEIVAIFIATGIITGTVGIVYAHELMHQRSKLDRWLGDILMAMTLYGHFRSEHLRVHHSYVGTPRDAVTARYNENFHRYFFRVVPAELVSSFLAEKALLARKGLPWWDRSNPFWRYWTLQTGFALLALVVGGWIGLGLFVLQAVVAFWQLELVNYVEHYGLVRKHLGGGKYEPARTHHSWNATQKASNWLLINLQRHADHHTKPDRPYPLLQANGGIEAPQLPYGYPIMTAMALVPPLWRREMNPRVRKWRAMYYPEITDWEAYSKMSTPMPR